MNNIYRTVNKDNNTVKITSYNGIETEKLIIPESINSLPVSEIANNAFANNFGNKLIKSVFIPKNIKNIGNNAFIKCDNLVTIEFEDDSKVERIGNSAFWGCVNLNEVSIPGSVDFIGDHAFSYCDKLQSILVEDSNGTYSSQNGVLYNKDKTELIYYPQNKLDTTFNVPTSVKKIRGNAFRGNPHLKTVNLESVEEVGQYAFVGCENLKNINAGPNTKFLDNPLSNTVKESEYRINFYASDTIISLEDLEFDNIVSLSTEKSGKFALRSTNKKIFVMLYEKEYNSSGQENIRKLIASNVGEKLVPENELIYELQQNKEYFVYLIDDYSMDTTLNVYGFEMEQIFEELPDNGTVVSEIPSQEAVYYKYMFDEHTLKDYSLQGDLKDVKLVVYNDAFQPLIEVALDGESYKLSCLHRYYQSADNNCINYIALINTGGTAKNIALNVASERPLSGNSQGDLTTDNLGNGYISIEPAESGIYSFSADGNGSFTVNIFDSSLNQIFLQENIKNCRASIELVAGESYIVEFTSDSDNRISYDWYFNPARIYINENYVEAVNGNNYQFVPKLDGRYKFHCDIPFTINGIVQDEVDMSAGNRYYIEFTESSASANNILTIELAYDLINLNSEESGTAPDGKFYRFEPTQTGNYKFIFDFSAYAEYNLYDENLNLIVNGAAEEINAVLENEAEYYLHIISDGQYSINAAFDPPEINVNNQVQIKGLHWYKFIPQYSEEYMFYVLSKYGGNIIISCLLRFIRFGT